MEPDRAQPATLHARVEQALDLVRPMLQMDGGDVALDRVEGGTAYLRLLGACGGCPMSSMTLTSGIERTLRQAVPEIERVEAI